MQPSLLFALLAAAQRTPKYAQNEEFTGNAAAVLAVPRNFAPGAGTWGAINDVESLISIQNNRLNQPVQYASATDAWGNARLVGGTGITRAAGRVVSGVFSLEDAAAHFAFLLEGNNAGTADPRSAGLGLLNEGGNGCVITPANKVQLDQSARFWRPTQYVWAVALNDIGGVMLASKIAADPGRLNGMEDYAGIPAWPYARILFAEAFDTTTPLYIHLSGFGSGNGEDAAYQYLRGKIERIRVTDVAEWSAADALAIFSDRFGRANGALGNNWNEPSGAWAIAGNKVRTSSSSGFIHAWHDTDLPDGDGIWECSFTVPSGYNGSNASFGMTLRVVDDNNYLRLWNDGIDTIKLQTIVGGSFDRTLLSTAFTWTAGQTYRLTCMAKGGFYHVLIDGATVTGSSWADDLLAFAVEGRGVGIYGAGSTIMNSGAPQAEWDGVIVYPLTVPLPPELQVATVPLLLSPDPSSPLASDDFQSAAQNVDGRIPPSGPPWVAEYGTWEIVNPGSVACTATTGGEASSGVDALLSDLATPDADVSVSIAIPPGFVDTDTTESGHLRSGLVLRWTNSMNYWVARIFSDESQFGAHEIEMIRVLQGSAHVMRKVHLGTRFLPGGSIRLRAQCKQDAMIVYIDDIDVLTVFDEDLTRFGTRFGIAQFASVEFAAGPGVNPFNPSRCVFSGYLALPL